MPPKKNPPLGAIAEVTGTALAAHLDTTRETIGDYLARGIIAKLPSGKYDQDECRYRVLRHLRDRAAGRTGNAGGGSENNLATARAELANVQREAIEWKNAVNRGDFISAEVVIRRLQDTFAIQRTLLLSWAGKLPSQLDGLTPAEIEAILEREVYEVLEALASPDTYAGRSHAGAMDEAGDEGDLDLPAASEAQPRRVGRQSKKGRG